MLQSMNGTLRWIVTFVAAAWCLLGCARLDDAPVCRPEARRCAEGTAQFCDAEGHWSVPEICPMGTACVNGTCQSACGDACRPGERRCAPEGVQVCERGASTCGQWGLPQPCGLGERCESGTCVDDCAAACEPGALRCLGEGQWVECLADPPCNGFGPPTDCGVSEEAGPLVCSGGVCGPVGSCADQCREGEWTCLTGAQAQRCERTPGGCLDWAVAVECAVGQICRGGQGCASACEDECEADVSRCVDGGRQVCVVNPAGCAVWGAITACGDGTCEDGRCADTCTPECSPGQTRCGPGGGVETCDLAQDCPRFGPEVPCNEGAQCAGAGVCGVCEPGQTEAQACGNCGQQVRTCGEVDRRWDDFGACEGEGVCTPGSEQACGRCGVQRCADDCTWGPCEAEGVCDPGTREACGNCGSRGCNAACQWDACGGEGVCAPGERRDCNACGEQGCTAQCQWEPCNNGDGTEFRRCNTCGWQFCCPNGNWCDCAPHYACDGGRSCVGSGQCN